MQGVDNSELTVAVVDDDRDLRVTLVKGLKTFGINCHPVASGSDLVDALEYLDADCILLDLNMPDMSGLELLARLPREYSHIPVIVFSSYGDIPTAVDAMRKGAVEFLEKPMPLSQISERIRSVVASSPRKHLIHTKAEAKRLFATLTPRETQIIGFVTKGLKNPMIANKLGISVRTVEVHRGHAQKKLHVSGLAELIRLVQAAGV